MSGTLTQAAQTIAPATPMQAALSNLHSEIASLEDMARSLEQKLISVLEPVDNKQAGNGGMAPAPAPVQVISNISAAQGRVTMVRSLIENLLDRLHV